MEKHVACLPRPALITREFSFVVKNHASLLGSVIAQPFPGGRILASDFESSGVCRCQKETIVSTFGHTSFRFFAVCACHCFAVDDLPEPLKFTARFEAARGTVQAEYDPFSQIRGALV